MEYNAGNKTSKDIPDDINGVYLISNKFILPKHFHNFDIDESIDKIPDMHILYTRRNTISIIPNITGLRKLTIHGMNTISIIPNCVH